MSAQTWVDEDCRRLLSLRVPEIVDGLMPFGLQSVFLGGSAVLGEAVGWEDPGGARLLLSDLDVGAIVTTPVPSEVIDSIVDHDSGESPGVSLGCYEVRFLARQAQTPGLADLAAEGHVLWGDQSALRLLRVLAPEAIPIWEAYRLIGNRCIEIDAAEGIGDPRDQIPSRTMSPGCDEEACETGGSPATSSRSAMHVSMDRVRVLYALAKASTDLWTSWMVAKGAYRVGWRERSAALDRDTLDAPDEVLSAALTLRDFRTWPSLDRLLHGTDPEKLFAAGLKAWLKADPGGFRRPGRGLEDSFLREPVHLRRRLQSWRRTWGRPGLPLFALMLMREGVWQLTPEGVKMASSARRRIEQVR